MTPYDLSSDVMFEILSRVPLKTLGRCRLLSKECNTLTYESSFMGLHCQRSKTMAGFFIQSLKNNRFYSTFLSVDNPGLDTSLSLDFLPNSVKILAGDQGLLFCVTQSSNNCYYICKPSTRQWESIPNPISRSFRTTAMMVLGSNPVRFKIVRLYDPEPDNSELDIEYLKTEFDDYRCYPCEIFDSDTWTWKQLNDVIVPYNEFFDSKTAISVRGGLHWLTSNVTSDGIKNNILSFYEDKETWELVSQPDSLFERDHWHSVNLGEYEGKLALCVMPDIDFAELWVMKDCHGERLWSQRHTPNLIAFNKEIGHSSFSSFYNADTLLMIGFFSAIFYNFKNGQFDRLELSLKHKCPESAFFIHTDYEPINLRQPRKDPPRSIVAAPNGQFDRLEFLLKHKYPKLSYELIDLGEPRKDFPWSIVTAPIFITISLFISFLICFVQVI